MAEHVQIIENTIAQQPELPPLEVRPPEMTAEEVQAVDQVFSGGDGEAATVAGLIGLWSSTVLLRDLAIEHLDQPEEKPKAVPKKKKDEE